MGHIFVAEGCEIYTLPKFQRKTSSNDENMENCGGVSKHFLDSLQLFQKFANICKMLKTFKWFSLVDKGLQTFYKSCYITEVL